MAGLRVLITGASSGIGAALARAYAARGARLVLAARRLDALEAVAVSCRERGAEVATVAADVTRDGDCERAVAAAQERFGGLDIVIANAGFAVAARFDALTIDDYRRQLETNVFGVLRTAYAALPALRPSRGRLALVGSVAGWIPTAGASAYSMSKFAVRALAESLRVELARDGVSVTLLSPGFVASDFRRVDNAGSLHADAPETVPSWLIVPAEHAARAMVRAIDRRVRERVITGHGKLLVWLYRHAPWLIRLALATVALERRKSMDVSGADGSRR